MEKDINLTLNSALISPNSRVLLIGYKNTELSKILKKYCQKREIELVEKEANREFLALHRYETELLDLVVLNLDDILEKENRVHILERIYIALKNGANLLLVLKNSEIYDYYEYENFLLGVNYVAISEIVQEEEYTLICAKKMHGWDGAKI